MNIGQLIEARHRQQVQDFMDVKMQVVSAPEENYHEGSSGYFAAKSWAYQIGQQMTVREASTAQRLKGEESIDALNTQHFKFL